MNRRLSVVVSLLLAMLMLCSAACAETISLNGTVTVKKTAEVYAPIGGTVQSVDVEVGQSVKADDVLATLKTNKVYATEAGTVTGLFGQPGDSADTITARYGAVMYIEGKKTFTLSATTDNAYNATANKLVHVGETVYLTSRSDSAHKGEGVITAVNGTGYTVEIASGTFEPGESCDVFRAKARNTSSRIGRGSVARVNPVAVTGTGSIVSYAVKDGAKVTRGQLLFETLDGTFDGLYMSGSSIKAGVDGVVGQLNVAQGNPVQKNAVAAVIYPAGSMQIEATVNESDLSFVHVGDAVTVELNWNQDDDQLLNGTIAMISAVANQGAEATYTVYVDFTPDANTRYGMSAVVNTLETADAEVEEIEAEEAEPVEEAGVADAE